VDNRRFGHLNYVDPASCATAEILWDLFKESGRSMPKDALLGIYTGIITDTGHFTYSNTTSKAHAIAHNILSAGINPEQIFRHIYANRSLAGLKLWGYAFMRASSTSNGKAVISWLKLEDFEKLGADSYDSEGIVNQLLYVRGAKISAAHGGGRRGARQLQVDNRRIRQGISPKMGWGRTSAGCCL